MRNTNIVWRAAGLAVLLFTAWLAAPVRADAPAATEADVMLPQRVIYIGHRPEQFEPFLKKHFAKVQTVALDAFQPALANDFDVVLLDWPQTGGIIRHDPAKSPLGERASWHKPTVLLGSA